MNAVVAAVLIMLILSALRVNVTIALIVGAFAGGIIGGLGVEETINVFSTGLGDSATVALSYAMLGGFAVAISKTGLPEAVVDGALKVIGNSNDSKRKALSKVLIVLLVLIISCFSQNVIPVHIAFIPILIPALLRVFNELELDRRLITCVITFGLITPYIFLPAGFGKIYHDILAKAVTAGGVEVNPSDIPTAMAIPALGMVVGLIIALFSYRKPRVYKTVDISEGIERITYSKRSLIVAIIAVLAALVVQLLNSDSDGAMIFGALAGIIILTLSGATNFKEADEVLTDGMKMMAFISFVLLSSAGFASVITETGDVNSLVNYSADLIGDNKALGAFLMLVVGLLVTVGVGSSFSTVPIIAAIFVPLCVQLGFSPLATLAIIGTAGALGDAGSPVSDSTLGPTSGLNVDGQHDHIWDTCVPTFIHYNFPLLVFGWIAAVVL
ncbi:Na+/H+ antiporter family protein [Priestia endophytica]|jgi:predicted histidine transporter YuiF (NhaC family)|uniref:Na+/H+ antiporter family protein n=1 Tax=Priestia endophytica TaxID=135735 RepID=UPI000DCA322A|nr:Na+/H+ antiporter family protein [Priestia endophytica]KAB2492243.1 Na+/H+ antiporter family protein [Priestia endophytica]RAS81317.1 sodium:proton antiporter [Priestia endophytica]RAS87477.1 sodium:proton antiporter [Priestia endophytica]